MQDHTTSVLKTTGIPSPSKAMFIPVLVSVDIREYLSLCWMPVIHSYEVFAVVC